MHLPKSHTEAKMHVPQKIITYSVREKEWSTRENIL